LPPAVAHQLVSLRKRAMVRPGRGSRSPERRAASAALWQLVDRAYDDGVPARELAEVLGIARGSVLTQLRHHGYLGGPSPSMRRLVGAAGPSPGASRPPPTSARLEAAATRSTNAREDLRRARAEARDAWDALRRAVIAEHATGRLTVSTLAAQAGVTVRTVHQWLQPEDMARPAAVRNPRSLR
jgi:AraC-like DNA-binding protein